MQVNRRHFLRNAFVTAACLFLIPGVGARKRDRRFGAVGCSPGPEADNDSLRGVTATVHSAQSGRWSDAATWGGKQPGATDTPRIEAGHIIIYDVASTTVAGLNISEGGTLIFEASKSVLLQSTGNVVVEGMLNMEPASANIYHTLRFTGIDETRFVGGGMNVQPNDVGIWVMGTGQVNLVGTAKTAWTKATGSIAAGATAISLEKNTAWKPGDLICITPTESPAVGTPFTTGFDERTIKSVNGNTITLETGTARPHPMVNNQWTAEVINLSRNVAIGGTEKGRAHLFIRSAKPQTIKYITLQHVGPRRDRKGTPAEELVAGRYGMHFHFSGDGSRGSMIEGNVIMDAGNHSYVPHVSHGITFVDNIAYRILETAFWWDPGDPTHDCIYDHNIVANCQFVQGALNMNGEDAPSFSSSGFALNTGDSNICRNNVVVGGGQGDFADGGAFNWEANLNEGIWEFHDNLAHNNDNGLRVWQNSTRNHIIRDFTAYHNGVGIFHGAYANSYTYTGGILYGSPMIIKAASSNSNRVRVENITIDGAGIINNGVEVIHSPLKGTVPVFLRNVTIRNCKQAALLDSAAPEVHSTDLVQCTIDGAILLHPEAADGETIRVQPASGQPYQITKAGKTNIAAFSATTWGTGQGLKAEYFNQNDLSKPALTRIDSNVSFSEWSAGVHFKITGKAYSVRWTGQIQAQFSEEHVFHLGSGGGHRLWVDDRLILDGWQEHYPDVYRSSSIALKAGQRYNIRLEFFNTDDNTGMGLFWSCPGLPIEYVPQTQLYAEAVTPPPQPPTVSEPVVVAQVIRNYIEVHSPDNSNYHLYDAMGRLLKHGSLTPGTNFIYVTAISSGSLFLKLSRISKAYKLIKI
ncbi:PA14 domain-containing protein [Paraflavitalea sp. CAU 1676]|uniref:PA14 domain-containing protein n=1 Tax=Paraflavitalea sp. CAU 1676 TaxID=3032598 RepID=UPI0023DA1D32|nr:PA14 domain-containing protein [Paraflavitalea sp. CAU 1676]MDF2189676.1 PA14 domain-containing protein [Paraflavitalea sp. CAU 1676]